MAFDFDESGALVSNSGGFDFDESGNPIDNTPAKPRAGYQAITDTALEIGSGAAKGIKFMADAFGADNTVSKALDEVSIYAKGLQSAQAKGEDQRVAAIMQEAQDKGVWEQVKAALSAAGEAPIRQSLGAIGTGLPMIAASALPGLREASWGTRLATLGGMGAVQGAGIAKDSIRDAVYERAKSEGYDDTTAAAAADKAQEYGGANTDQIALSGLINAGATATGFAPAALRAMSKEGVKRAVTPTLAKELGMGVVKEVPLEAVQGGQEQLAGNIAQQRTGFETPLMRGVVGQAALEGMLATPGGIAGGTLDYMAPDAKPKIKPDDILKAPTVDDAIAAFHAVGKQWQDLGIGPQTGSLETQRLAEQAGQSFQSLGIDQGASDLATQRRNALIAQAGEQYKALGLTDPTDDIAAQKRISEVGNEWKAIESGKQADAEWQSADKAARIERQQEEARRLMAERDARIADAGSQAKPILDRIDAENADLEDLVQSETRSKQVMLAQLEQDRLKQAEINAAFEDKPNLDLRTKAVQQAATLDAPTALGDKLRQALAPKPVETPVTPIPATPTLPRVVDRFAGMVAMPQKLAEMTAERTGGEVVRVPNIDKTTGKPNGKFAFTVLNEQNTPSPTGTQTQAAPTQETAPAREPDTAAVAVPATGANAPTVEADGVEALKKQLETVDPMSEDHYQLLQKLRPAVTDDATKSIEAGDMPVYAVGNGLHVAISPSAQSPGKFQVTRYSDKGIIGDTQYNSIDDAVSSEGLMHKERVSTDVANQVIAKSLEAESRFNEQNQPVTQAEQAQVATDGVDVYQPESANKFANIDKQDDATKGDMLQFAASRVASDSDLSAILDRLPDAASQEPYVGNTSRIAWAVVNNDSASPRTKQRAQAIYDAATRPTAPTHTTNEAGNVTVYGDPAEVRKAHPQAKGVTVFADGKATGVMFSVPDSPAVLAKINPQPQTNGTQTDQTIEAQPATQEAATRQLTDDELFTQELERLYQADIKESIKQRLGLSKPVTETVQAQKNTPFKAFLKKYKIKSSLARDIFDNAFKANQALPGTFKQDGLGLDELVTMAIQSGFMLPGDVDSNNDNGGTNKLVEMIQAEIRGEAQMPIGMASDNAQESIEMRERMDLEDEADRLGLRFDATISIDKLASMVHRVQRKIGSVKTGSLKADRVLKNAQDAAQRIERKRAELEAASEEFDKASIAEQDALLEIFMDDDGNPVIVLLSDIEANRAWYEQNPTRPQYDTSTEQDQGQVGAPDATATGQGVEDGGTTGTGTQRQDDQGQEAALESYTRADVLAEQARIEQIEKDKAKADQDAEAKAKADRIAKEIQARQEASADNFQLGQSAEDALAGQGSIFDMPEPSISPAAQEPAKQATAILDAANVTGKERIDVLKDVKQGTITPEELQAAYPAAEQQKPSWHTDIPAKGVSVAAGDEKLDGSRQVLYRIATEAVNALTQNQKMNGQRLYAYYLPSTPTEHGALRLFPDDQTPPKPWTLLKPEGIPVGMLTPDNLIAQLRNDLQNAPVLTSGNEKEILAQQASNQKSDEKLNDRNNFTLDRLNQETREMEQITFSRGEYVRHKLGNGDIDGISHARKEFSVDGIWFPFGYAYKSERPEVQQPETVPMQSVIDDVNAKHGKGLTDADIVPNTNTILDIEKSLWTRIVGGSATVDEFKSGFNRWVNNKGMIIEALMTKTKEQLLKLRGNVLYDRYKNSNKTELVDAMWRDGAGRYVLGHTLTYGMGKDSYISAIRTIVENTDSDKLAQYAADINAEQEETVARITKTAEAIKDPKTLEDFSNLLRSTISSGKTFKESRMLLTPEQRATFDSLTASESRSKRQDYKNAKQEQAIKPQSEALTASEIIKTTHTKHGHDLWQFDLDQRVSSDEFKSLVAKAKLLNGTYSSYRGNGAIPGWQFKTESGAKAFRNLIAGDDSQAKDVLQSNRDVFADDRSQSATQRLTEMADRLEIQADASLNQERKQNTDKRARQAASAEAAASAEKAMAKTMRNIARTISNGSAKFLDKVRQKTQVSLLLTAVNNAKYDELRAKYESYADQEKHKGELATIETADYAEFPSFTAYRSDLASLARQLIEVDGTKKIGQQLLKVADDVSDAYLKFAKDNFSQVASFTKSDGGIAGFGTKEAAEAAIARSGYKGKAIAYQVKRGEHTVIMSPSEAIGRGIWKGDGDKRISLSSEFGSELVEKIGKASRRGAKVSVPWQFETAFDKRKALERMGIETPAEYRAALREFIGLQEVADAPNKVRQLERAMIGRRNDGLDFFPTPESVADEMVEAAGIENGMTVLEPSAGWGHIAERIRAAGVEPDVGEMAEDRRELLEAKGFNLVSRNFLEMSPRGFTYGDVFKHHDGRTGVLGSNGGLGSSRYKFIPVDGDGRNFDYVSREDLTGVEKRGSSSGYDRILMNPPFSDNRDIQHVKHAFSLLKPDGRLIAIMGESAFTNQNKVAIEFREWLDSVGGTYEKLPEGSFNNPNLPVNTGANARMVVIDKTGIAMFSLGMDQGDSQKPNQPSGKKSPEVDSLNAKMLEQEGIENAFESSTMGDSEITKAFKKVFGVDVVAVRATGKAGTAFMGVYHDGKLYVNAEHPRAGFVQIAGHELLHHIERDNPQAYAYFADKARAYLLDGAEQKYAERLKNAGGKDGDAYKEMLADFVGDSIADPAFLQTLADANPTKFKAFVGSVVSWLKKVAEKLRIYSLGSSQYFNDVDGLREYLAAVLDVYAGTKKVPEQTETEAFKKWFGDSKVVDADGKPLVVYHGTTASFDTVDMGKTERLPGFWLTPESKLASSYAANGVVNASSYREGANVMPLYARIEKPYIFNPKKKGFNWAWDEYMAGDYDGFIEHGNDSKGITTMVVKSANQVKSAIGNNGDFDVTNHDIRYSRGDTLSPGEEFWRKIKSNESFTKQELADAYSIGRRGSARPLPSMAGSEDQMGTEAAKQVAKWSSSIAGFEGYRTLGVTTGSGNFAMAIIPDELYAGTANPAIADGMILGYSFKKLPDGSYRMDISEATPGTSAFDALRENDKLKPTGKFDTNQNEYNQVVLDNPYSDSRMLMQEAVRRLSIHLGKVPTIVQAGRDTGSRAGDMNPRSFSSDFVEANFSRSLITNAPLPQTWQAPDASKMDDFIYSIQDKHVDTKRVQKAIKAAIGAIDDAANPYLQEELYHGRASMETKEFLEKEIRPFLTDLQARGVDLSDFEEYLHNRHAERRNVQVAKINPNMQDGGSGIKTADARAYLANLPQAKRQTYTSLAKRIDAINKTTRKLLVESGLETQETIDAWTKAYGDEYVPLMREEMDNGRTGIGQGFSVRGGSSKRALGSGKPVANIFANIALQREKAITRSKKQKIGHALYGLVLKAPNPDFWFAIDPDLQRNPKQVMDTQMQLIDLGFDPADAESIAREPKERYYNPTTKQVDTRINPLLRSADNVLAVRIEGQDKYVFFNARDKRAMRMVSALKNLDADQLGAVMSQTAKMTRYFSAVNTQWNPIFGVTNITRDIQTALINLESTALKGHKKDVMKHIFPALRGIYIDLRDHRAGKQPTSAYAAIFEEFQREGGATGYRDMYANAEDRADAIKSEIEGIKSGKLKQAGKAVLNWLSDYNESMENAVRVAAYKVGTDNGMTKQQAASLAKNLTVNFNRKGQVALQAGALYAFFNASVQGTARIAETVMDGNKLSALGKKIVTGGLLLGGMQALLMSMADFDEDEPPDFVRERNLIIPTGGDHYISIPMPLGFHVLPNLSRIPTEWALGGFKDTPKRIGQMVGLFFDAFNPIGSAGLSLQTITPTVIDPFAALAENKDFTGKAIARKDFDPLHPTAGHTRAKDTATPWAKFTSLAINYATGGTDYKPGIVSPTPDQIDYLIGQVTGGVGREVSKSAQVFESSTSGEEIPLYKIPLVGRFLGTTEGQAPETGRFYENLKRIGEHKSEIEGLRKDRRFEESFVYMRENPESRLIKLADDAHNDVSKLNRLKRDLIKQDASKERIKLIEMQITSRMKRLNDRIKAVKELEPA